jgi:hypothetical protein
MWRMYTEEGKHLPGRGGKRDGGLQTAGGRVATRI